MTSPWTSFPIPTQTISGSTVIASGSTIARTLATRFADIINVKDYGATGNGSTDDTTAIQNALTANPFDAVLFPQGTYAISSPLAINDPTLVIGYGTGISTILQTNLSANVFNINNANSQGGGIINLGIRGNAPFFNSPGTSGIALNLTETSENFVVNNVWIRNCDIGIKFGNSCFSNYFEQITIDYFQTYGIWIPPVTSGDAINDNRFSQVKIQNINFVQADGSTPNVPNALASPPSANTQIGVFYQESGGDTWKDSDCINCGYGLVCQPPNGKFLLYINMADFLSDTSYYENMVFDGTAGTVAHLHFLDPWAAFSLNGSGILTEGGNLYGLQFIGGRVRQNGKHGWNHSGGQFIKFVGTNINDNSKLATLTYNGVNVANSLTDWALIGCKIGNFPVGSAWQQLNNILMGTGCSNYSIVDCDLTGAGAGGVSLSDASASQNKRIRGNFPVLNAVDQVPSSFQSATASIGSGTTTFLGQRGASTTEADVFFMAHKPIQVFRWSVAMTAEPGAGQSFSFQISLNGVLQGSAVLYSGTGGTFNIGDQFGSFDLNEFDTITIKLITSAGATSSQFRYFLEYSE